LYGSQTSAHAACPSEDATAQAQAVLERFFRAYDAGDLDTFNSLRVGEPSDALSVTRVEAESITPVSSEPWGRAWRGQ